MSLAYESGDLDVNVVPSHYKVSLTLRPAIVTGSVEIELDILQGFSASCIPIHADPSIGITRAALCYATEPQQVFELQDLTGNSYMQLQTLHFLADGAGKLPTGKAKLSIEFTAPVRTQKAAYAIYQIAIGKEIGFATQFEPVGAREAFPCFDEPAIRTTFQLELTVPKGQKALSNTKLVSKAANRDSDTYLFKPTIKMSSYLLCFVVGPFCALERTISVTDGSESRELQISVWSPEEALTELDQALTWACNAVAYFTRTFACLLPLEKLDLVTLPLGGLGMENFGILTFRTGYLAISASTELALSKRICLLILHEVSHLWFGDLVTVRWWSYLYLKEGFARLLEYTVANVLYPEHSWWDHFLANHYGRSRQLDMDPVRTHPVEVAISRAKSSEDIFDFISYAKGASVLRMSSDMLGAELFLQALPSLINTHLYKSIETTDLWACFKSSSGINVDVMDKWVKHSGHPSLSFHTQPFDQNDGTPSSFALSVTQHLHIRDIHRDVSLLVEGEEKERAIASDIMPNTCVDQNGLICYPIPLLEIKIFTLDGQCFTEHKTLFTNNDTFTINVDHNNINVILLNASHRGYYAVDYTAEQWNAIHAHLALFSPTEILGLLIEIHQANSPNAAHTNALEAHARSMDNIDIKAYLNIVGPRK